MRLTAISYRFVCNVLETREDTAMWKDNWKRTQQHFRDWWNQKGLIIGMWAAPPCDGTPHEDTKAPPDAVSAPDNYVDAGPRARRNHHRLAQRSFPADVLPISDTDLGPGSLALLLGCKPGFAPNTVWFEPCIQGFGGQGVYALTSFASSQEAETLAKDVEQYR